MKRMLVLAVFVATIAAVSVTAWSTPASTPPVTAGEAAPELVPEPVVDLLPAAPSPPDCLIFFCAELGPCACENPLIVVGQACEDENGRLLEVGRCTVGGRLCSTPNLSTCE